MSRRADRGPSQRQLRVGEELRHALAWILERGEVRDPDIKGVCVTVTEVRVSPDLRNAIVFVLPLGGGETEAIVTGLTRARPFLRRQVANAVRLKFVPDITFRADKSFDEASRIDTLLRDPAVARDLAGDRAEDEENHGA